MTTLEQLAARRTPRRALVDAHKAGIRAQVRAYREREARDVRALEIASQSVGRG